MLSPFIQTTAPYILISSTAGLLLHHGLFINGEWHLHVFSIVVGHILAFAVTLNLLPRFKTFVDSTELFTLWISMCTAYLVSLWTSMVVYRLWFHKLSGFKGPRLAAVTKFWHVWMARKSRNYQVLWNMWKRYGKVVRTGKSCVLQETVLGSCCCS
jgi:hypothetical protein